MRAGRLALLERRGGQWEADPEGLAGQARTLEFILGAAGAEQRSDVL